MASEGELPARPEGLVGTWRRFGTVGPVYQITAIDHALPDGDWLLRVRVLESGEEVGYKFSDVVDDPKEG